MASAGPETDGAMIADVPAVLARRAAAFLLIASAAACARGAAPPDTATLGPLDPAVRALLDERTSAVNADRGDPAAWGELGMAFEANGLLPQAEAAFVEAARRDPREARWRYRTALLRARRGELDGARADIDAVVALAPDYVPARWHQGQWRLDQGDLAGAEAAFRSALAAAPGDESASAGLAQVQLARNENAAAAATLEALLASAPGNRYALHLLGTAYRRLGREDEAQFALKVGAMGQPSWPDPWSEDVDRYRRGFAVMLKDATRLGLERRFDEAIALLNRLCALRPDDTALRVYLGGMYASSGRIGEARATLEPILAADPNHFDATMHLASGYLFAGDLDSAAALAAKALALRPSSADAAKLRGVVAWQQGRTAEADALFTAATDADPRDPMPALYQGMILGQQARYIEARRRFEQALATNPLLGDALLGVADTYAAMGDFAEAGKQLARAAQVEPGNPRLPAAQARITAAAARGR
jgi:tetratricopeptide (TPR) repeat protein